MCVEKPVEICPDCSEIQNCKMVAEILNNSEEAKKNLLLVRENNHHRCESKFEEENKMIIKLEPLKREDRNQFILDNQEAFNYGALEEFGKRDDHFEEDGEIISRETIEKSIDSGEAFRIVSDGVKEGGIVVRIDGTKGYIDLLFVSPTAHSKGIGYAAWCEMEKKHIEVEIWETVTPYFEKRNIHFYVNRCGFHIVEFFNRYHPDPNELDTSSSVADEQFPDGMFRFEKKVR